MQLDIKGHLSKEAMKMINYTQALAPAYISSFIATIEQASKSLGNAMLPPFVVYAAYNHNSDLKDEGDAVKEKQEARRLAKGKEKEDSIGKHTGHASFNPRALRRQVLSFTEGDPI